METGAQSRTFLKFLDVSVMSKMIARAMIRAKLGNGAEDDRWSHRRTRKAPMALARVKSNQQQHQAAMTAMVSACLETLTAMWASRI